METDNIIFAHRRDENNIPYATLAAKVTDDGLVVGGSLCSENDNPEYKKGRLIASERLKSYLKGKKPRNLAAFFPDVKNREQVGEILSSLQIESEQTERGLKLYKIVKK